MTRLLQTFSLLIVVGFGLGACMTGPEPSQALAAQPAPNMSRIWFYRDHQPIGVLVQPTVYVDGQPVGEATPGTAFAVDVPPGRRIVRTTTEVSNFVEIDLAPGQQAYMRLDPEFGLLQGRVRLEQVPPQVGMEAISGLSIVQTARY